MEHTVFNQLKSAIIERNSADVALLVPKVAKLKLEYFQYEPLIIEAIRTDEYDILKPVLDVSFSTYPSNPHEWTFRNAEIKNKPTATRIIGAYILHVNLNSKTKRDPKPFVIEPNQSPLLVTKDNELWIKDLLLLKRVDHRRHNYRVRWLVYILHQSNVISYADLVREPTLLSALARWPETNFNDFLNARAEYGGANHTLLYNVIIRYWISYSEKWKFVKTLEELCEKNKKEPSCILNPDLTELAACIIRNEMKLFKHLAGYAPEFNVPIDNVPDAKSPAGQNLTHYFADYCGPQQYTDFAVHTIGDLRMMLITEDKEGTYSVDNLLRLVRRRKDATTNWALQTLVESLEVIVKKDRSQLEKMDFIYRTRYWLDTTFGLYLYYLGFRHASLQHILTGLFTSYIPINMSPASFAETEVPTEFPIYQLPIELLGLISQYFSMHEVLSVFCLSRKCYEMKKLLLPSSFWSQYFKSHGPFKYAEFLAVSKEMRETYIDSHIKFNACLKRGLLRPKDPNNFTTETFWPCLTMQAMDNNWILFTDCDSTVSTNMLYLKNCWTKDDHNLQKFPIKKAAGNTVGNFLILNSTPEELSFGYIEKDNSANYIWNTYQNQTLKSTVVFKSSATHWEKMDYYDGKLYVGKNIYDFRHEVPRVVNIPGCSFEAVNKATGISIFTDEKSSEFNIVNKEGQTVTRFQDVVASVHSSFYRIKFVDEYTLVNVWQNRAVFFDMRKPGKSEQVYGVVDKNHHPRDTFFTSHPDDYLIVSNSNGFRTVWDLRSRTCASAFYMNNLTQIIGMNSHYLVTKGKNSLSGVIMYSLDEGKIGSG